MARRAKEKQYQGRTFGHISEIAQELGVTRSYAYRLVKLGKEFTPFAPGECHRSRGGKATSNPVAAAGRHWQSQTAAAKDLGTTVPYVTKLLREGRFEKYVAKRLAKLGATQ